MFFDAIIGMTWWVAVLFFLMYFALALAITRMRAELGTPITIFTSLDRRPS